MATVTRDLRSYSFSASADVDNANLTVALNLLNGASATTYPADFSGTVTAVSIASTTTFFSAVSVSDDSIGLEVRIETSGGTILAANTAGGAYETAVTTAAINGNRTGLTVNFAYVNGGASKADWEGAVIRYNQRISKLKGADGCYMATGTVSNGYAKITVTYTPAAGDIVVPVTGVAGTGQVGSVTATGKAIVAVTGLEATGEVGTADAHVNATAQVTGLEATGATGASTSVDTYYFDASIAGPTDASFQWSEDANAFDGNAALRATNTNPGYVLKGTGTTAPTSGGTITQVRAQTKAVNTVAGFNSVVHAEVYSSAELLGDALNTVTVTEAFGDWVVLSAPTGGWTWTAVNGLEVQFYGTQDSVGSVRRVYITNIEVTSGGVGTSVTGEANVPATGLEATGEVGTASVAAKANAPVTGLEATGEVGSVTVGITITQPVTGLAASGEVGSVSVAAKANAPVAGLEATGGVGTVTVATATEVVVPVTGLETTGEVGSSVASGKALAPVTGLEATGEVGSVTVTTQALIGLTGSEATGEVGSVTVSAGGSISVPLTGLEATGEVGTATVTGVATTTVTGVEATGEVGTAVAAGKSVVSVTGLQATGEVGTVTVSAGGSINVPVSGVEATGEVGSVTVIAVSNVDVPVTGVEATGEVGTATAVVGTDVVVPVTGVAANADIGVGTNTVDYYFDASLSGPTDADAAWNNNLIDFFNNDSLSGDTIYTSGTSGSSTFKNLTGGGTNVVAVPEGRITSVRYRVYGFVSGVIPAYGQVECWTEGRGELLQTLQYSNTGSAWSSRFYAAAPALGWTWDTLQKLELNCWLLTNNPPSSMWLKANELRVNYEANIAVTSSNNLSVSGLEATGQVGSVTVIEGVGISVPVTGVEATSAVGSVTVTTATNVTVALTGVEAQAFANGVFVRATITPSQNPNWAENTPTQSAGWIEKTPSQAPGWSEDAPSQDPNWQEIIIP